MCSEMQALILALEAQTMAIHQLVNNNTQILNLLIEIVVNENDDELPFSNYLSGKPIGNR